MSSLAADTNSRRVPPVSPKPSLISKQRDDIHKQKKEPSLLQGSDAVEGSMEYTVKCLEDAMREPNKFVLGLQKMLSTVHTQQSIEQQLREAHAQNNTLQKHIEEHQRRQNNDINLNAELEIAMEKLQGEHKTSTRRLDEIKTLKEARFQREEEIRKQVTEYEGKIFALESKLNGVELSFKESLDERIAQQKEQMEIDQSKQKQYEDIIENLNRKLNALAEVNELQVKKLTDLSSELQQRSVELETVYEHDEQVLSKIRSIVVHDVAYAGLQSPNKTNETKLKNIREEVLTKLTDRLRQSSALSLDDEERSMLQLVQIHLEAEIQTLQSEKEERTRYQRTAEEFGNSQIDYLEQQIQKQINDQRVAESIANEEITKLEDELEERKQNQVTAEVFADKELDKLESQLQEQKDNRRFIEKYASVEILKLEKIIEDKKRSLELAETFAETEISALETKIERKESTLKLVLRFSEAEISRLEDEVNDCLHLKDVLESEATSLRQELADLQHKEVTEIYHSKTHQITALTALDELHNTVSCLQKRIVELETNNSRHEEYEQHQLTDNDRRQADAVEELKTRLKEEQMKKMQAVNKLAELLNRSTFSSPMSPARLRRKENELDDMRQRLSTAKRKLQDTETVLTQKMKEDTYVLLQMRLDAKESEIEELKCKTPMSEESKIHMEGWLNVSMFGWNKLFVVVSLHHVMFFQNLEEKQRAMPMLVLDIVSIQDARTTTEDEDRELKNKDLSRIFVLVYDAAGEKVQGSSLDKEKKMSGDRTYKGHLFQDVQYRSPKTCDACKKSMWNALQPPPAVKCTGCNSKVHKYHYATDDGSVKPCPRIPIAKYGIGFNLRSLFLQTYSPDMRKAWMTHIMEKVQHLPESKSGHET